MSTPLEDSQQVYLGLLIENGQKVLFKTNLFGKEYVWMQDPESKTVYLERLYKTATGVSVDGQTGEAVPVYA